MRFTKPAWVGHHDTSHQSESSISAKPLPIFSVHVHPDGSRIATGGMDAKVRIWSTKPILNEASDRNSRPPKMLCTLTMHTGPVLTVRWAHSGRWLASGSDDQVVMVWDLDPAGGGKVWGSDEVNVEGWKPLKRLTGHESDVTDIAWAPNDRYLASVGLDSVIYIWCGYTLERLQSIKEHQGFVKGVCWDPVGEYLATQSDDRSVKIWRTKDWGMEAEITKPFEDSPGSTFFRRLSWSPDGAHITASNATNNKGFVFIAAVIARNSWTSEISLVGHENTVEVAAYNPHMFMRNITQPMATANICSVVALGADDRSVSVWQTKSARPLVVAKSVFERSIMDLSWSWDGLVLYAVSLDGTLGAFAFEKEELEGILPFSAQENYLKKFKFTPPPLPNEYTHPPPLAEAVNGVHAAPSRVQSQAASMRPTQGTGEVVNKLVAKRKDKSKKRLTLASVPTAAVPSVGGAGAGTPRMNGMGGEVPRPSQMAAKPMSSAPPGVRFPGANSSSQDGPPSMAGSNTPDLHEEFLQWRRQKLESENSNMNSAPISSSGFGFGFGEQDVDMIEESDPVTTGVEPSIAALDTVSPANSKGKRKASAIDLMGDEGRTVRARTLGGDRPRDTGPIKELVGLAAPNPYATMNGPIDALPIPPLMTIVSCKVEHGDVLEANNPEDGGPSEVVYRRETDTLWLDYVSSPVLCVAGTQSFSAVALHDGSINVYSPTGRKLLPTLSLGTSASHLCGAGPCLMAITSSGMLHAWNVKLPSALFSPVSLSPLLSSLPVNANRLLSAKIRSNGAPIFQFANGTAHSYEPSLSTFVKLSDKWWGEGSDAWPGRQRGTAGASTDKIVGSVEHTIMEFVKADASADVGSDAAKERPTWWNIALTLGHLESKMHAARVLDSSQEFKQSLLVYAQRIAHEGFRGKAEELIKELFGPTYWRPGRNDSWTPNIGSLSKRDLLKEVLNVFARSKTLTKLGLDWQDTLRKASTDDS